MSINPAIKISLMIASEWQHFMVALEAAVGTSTKMMS